MENSTTTKPHRHRILSQSQLETFRHDGVLVVPDVLTPSELQTTQTGLRHSLHRHQVDVDHLQDSGVHLKSLSSTNGSGGVLDLFYEDWKLEIAVHETLFGITTELWEAFYSGRQPHDSTWWHPYGTFDTSQGYAYLDRLCYRLPTKLAESFEKKPIQRSLTPHLDCCPDQMFHKNAKKWRPIQCFVSLTDTLHENHGGFQAAKGFHCEFDAWRRQRPLSSSNGQPAPCRGDYTHIRPKEDKDVMERILHIPVPEGAAVFWDHRIPHASSYRHNGTIPRAVAYCSFLPNIPHNRVFAKRQLQNWKEGRRPDQFWIKDSDQPLSRWEEFERNEPLFDSALKKRLVAIQEWE